MGRAEIVSVYLPSQLECIHYNFLRDGRYSERGWACTPHPHQVGLIFQSWWDGMYASECQLVYTLHSTILYNSFFTVQRNTLPRDWWKSILKPHWLFLAETVSPAYTFMFLLLPHILAIGLTVHLTKRHCSEMKRHFPFSIYISLTPKVFVFFTKIIQVFSK